jgi:hypothetical protein
MATENKRAMKRGRTVSIEITAKTATGLAP